MKLRSHANRGGFAVLTAIVFLGLCSVVAVVTLSLLQADARRTASEISRAQIDQLLLAGQEIVANELARDGHASAGAVTLPGELPMASLRIAPLQSADQSVHVKIIAMLGKEIVAETLRYEKADTHWRLIAVDLD